MCLTLRPWQGENSEMSQIKLQKARRWEVEVRRVNNCRAKATERLLYISEGLLELWFNFQVAISSIIYKRIARCHHTHRSLNFLLTQERSITNLKEQALLPYKLGIDPDTAPTSPYPTPLICSQCKFFQSNLHLCSPYLMCKEAHQLQDSKRASFPPNYAGGLDFLPQYLVFFLLATAQINAFFFFLFLKRK